MKNALSIVTHSFKHLITQAHEYGVISLSVAASMIMFRFFDRSFGVFSVPEYLVTVVNKIGVVFLYILLSAFILNSFQKRPQKITPIFFRTIYNTLSAWWFVLLTIVLALFSEHMSLTASCNSSMIFIFLMFFLYVAHIIITFFGVPLISEGYYHCGEVCFKSFKGFISNIVNIFLIMVLTAGMSLVIYYVYNWILFFAAQFLGYLNVTSLFVYRFLPLLIMSSMYSTIAAYCVTVSVFTYKHYIKQA